MSEQPKAKTFRDKRRPTPINVDIAKRGPGLSTPDVQDVQTPVLQKLLIQNQLGADTTTVEVKQESAADDSNPPSVDSDSSSENMSQDQDQTTVVNQSDNDNENGQPTMVLDSDKVLEVEVANVLLKASGNLQSVGIPSKSTLIRQ